MTLKLRLTVLLALTTCVLAKAMAETKEQLPRQQLLVRHRLTTPAPQDSETMAPKCPPTPKPSPWTFMGDTTLLTQLIFWFGMAGLLLTGLGGAAYICCCACSPADSHRGEQHHRSSSSSSREPLLPPPSILSRRERQSISRPASTQTRNPSPAETTNVTQAPGTYAIVYPPSYPSGGVRGGAAHPGVPQGAAVFHSWSPALAPHPEEEDHGYQSQRLQAYYVGGMPGYSAVGDAVPMNRPRRSSQEAMPSIPRSPPPPYPYQGYQH